jgi:hypothetical protein
MGSLDKITEVNHFFPSLSIYAYFKGEMHPARGAIKRR